MLLITLQITIQKLGPVPSDCGDFVRSVLEDEDEPLVSMPALGCYLDQCIDEKSYAPLYEFKKLGKD